MRGFIIGLLLMSVGLLGFKGFSLGQDTVSEIEKLKNGVLLVRLHTDDAVLDKLKELHEDRQWKYKKQEIYDRNLSVYRAFSAAYRFSEIRFFYSNQSKRVKAGDFAGVFLNDRLEFDPEITLPDSVPVFILDVGDIFFEHFGGHMEGVVIMNQEFIPLRKPFPYYVRKRSGLSIIKRSDLDIALILNKKLLEFHSAQTSHERSVW